MSFESEFERRRKLKEEERRLEKLSAIEIEPDKISEVDGMLNRYKDQPMISQKEQIAIFGDIKSFVYAADQETWEFWEETLENFKDKDAGKTILDMSKMYRLKKAS